MMRTMKLTFGGETFQALVDMENHIIFSAGIWHMYEDICCECEDAPKYNFRDYAYEVINNGSYYTSETFEYYNPWESDDCYQFWSDEGNMTGESWTFFIPGIELYNEDDFSEQLCHLVNQCDWKAEAAAVRCNKKNTKKIVKIA